MPRRSGVKPNTELSIAARQGPWGLNGPALIQAGPRIPNRWANQRQLSSPAFNSSGSLAMFAATRRASSFVSADRLDDSSRSVDLRTLRSVVADRARWL